MQECRSRSKPWILPSISLLVLLTAVFLHPRSTVPARPEETSFAPPRRTIEESVSTLPTPKVPDERPGNPAKVSQPRPEHPLLSMDLREETFRTCDEFRLALAGGDPAEIGAIRERIRRLGDRAWPHLLDEIRRSAGLEDSVRAAALAAQAVGLKDPSAFAEALHEGTEPDSDARLFGAWVLCDSAPRSPETAEQVRRLAGPFSAARLLDPSAPAELRAHSADIVATLDGPAAESLLDQVLRSEQDASVRRHVLTALGRIGVSGTSTRTLHAIAERDEDALVRSLARALLERPR